MSMAIIFMQDEICSTPPSMQAVLFTKSYVGYVHAVAHSLGGQYNVPHGLANAILLPLVLREYVPALTKKLHRLAIAAGLAEQKYAGP